MISSLGVFIRSGLVFSGGSSSGLIGVMGGNLHQIRISVFWKSSSDQDWCSLEVFITSEEVLWESGLSVTGRLCIISEIRRKEEDTALARDFMVNGGEMDSPPLFTREPN